MKLAEWRKSKGLSRRQVAEEIGCTVGAVWRYETGKRDPEAPVKEKIFLLSEGLVQPNDFYDMIGWRKLLSAAIAGLRGLAA